MIPGAKVMAEYRDASGAVVARVLQGAVLRNGRPVAVYYAEAGGDRVRRDRFACATRAVGDWAKRNGKKLVVRMV